MQQGSVITLAGAGVPKAFPNFSAYSTSKIAIIQLITNLAEEYPNIRFNAIAPGPVNTQFTDEVLRAGPEVVGQEFYDKNIAWQKGEQGAVSPGIAAEFMVRLVSGEINCTGKYLSAVWDKEFDTNPDMYTLKRIDGRNFGKK
jgi:NAD(P)-dependent dehydrogenase (short-subunit alcohol dehydrogenase family)